MRYLVFVFILLIQWTHASDYTSLISRSIKEVSAKSDKLVVIKKMIKKSESDQESLLKKYKTSNEKKDFDKAIELSSNITMLKQVYTALGDHSGCDNSIYFYKRAFRMEENQTKDSLTLLGLKLVKDNCNDK